MSDTKTKSESAKADGSSAAKSTPDKSTSESESASDTGAPDKIASEKSKSDGGGKSARESAGGSNEIHYGYFSNIKTPEYRSGWDLDLG